MKWDYILDSSVTHPMSCPLCSSTRCLLHRWHDLSDVRTEWRRGFGFDPFEKLHVESELRQYRCLDCDLRFYFPAICGDGNFYKELSTRFSWYYEKDKWEFDVAAEMLGALEGVKDVLEVGCGQGHFLARIQNLYTCEGVEFNPQAISDCQAKGLNVSSKSLESFNACFDVVAAFEVLEHLQNPRDFIDKALRALRPGGYLLLAVPDPESYFSEAERVLLDMPPHHVLSFSKTTFREIGEHFALMVLRMEQEPLRFQHYKSYISSLIGNQPSEAEKRSFLTRVLNRVKLTFSEKPNLENRLMEQITALQLATTYQQAKEKLKGQTHLVLYRKDEARQLTSK